MFDFYFGNKQAISEKEEDYLIFIKRMLPRWCNSIPDSEFIAVHRLLLTTDTTKQHQTLVETGIGASTIVLLNHAIKNKTLLCSWDINGNKGAYLRSVVNDTLCRHYGVNLWDHWKFIPYNSLSNELGIPILHELGLGVNFCFLDSEHTLNVLLGEIELLNPFLSEDSIVAIDDANYNYKYLNVSYINMQRNKLDLAPIENPEDNYCGEFYNEIEKFLTTKWKAVEHLDDSYKREFADDIFWNYFASDRSIMNAQGMEKIDELVHRFDGWRVRDRKVV